MNFNIASASTVSDEILFLLWPKARELKEKMYSMLEDEGLLVKSFNENDDNFGNVFECSLLNFNKSTCKPSCGLSWSYLKFY